MGVQSHPRRDHRPARLSLRQGFGDPDFIVKTALAGALPHWRNSSHIPAASLHGAPKHSCAGSEISATAPTSRRSLILLPLLFLVRGAPPAMISPAWRPACSRRRVKRLARGHEQAVALRAAEADVAADLGQADAADQLPSGRPHGDAVVTDGAPGVARTPDIAVDVATDAVGPAIHAVDQKSEKRLPLVSLLSVADIENESRPCRPARCRPGPCPCWQRRAACSRARSEAVRDRAPGPPVATRSTLPLGIDAVALVGSSRAARRPRPAGPARVQRPAGLVGPPAASGALRRAGAVGRIGEPVAAVGMRHDIVRRVQPLAVKRSASTVIEPSSS